MYRWLILLCAFLVFISACKDNVSKIDDLATECSNGNLKACDKLNDIAKNHEDQKVRTKAIHIFEKAMVIQKSRRPVIITESRIDLADYSKNIEDYGYALAPGDYELSVRFWLDINNKKYTSILLLSVSLEMDGLYMIYSGYQGGFNWSPSIKLICKGQKECASAAKNSTNIITRKAATRMLDNQNVLYDIAKNDISEDVRIIAIKKLTDQTQLIDIVKNEKDSHTRAIAVEKLSDQTLLIDFIKNDKDTGIRIAAVNNPNLTDQTLLADIAKSNNENDWVRIAATEKLKDQMTSKLVFDYIAKNGQTNSARVHAMRRVTDKKLIADIAKNDKDGWVRSEAERWLKTLQGK